MTTVTVAATQTYCTWNEAETLDRVEALVRRAAAQGAQIVLPQELFAAPYFCRDELQKHFALAQPIDGHPVVERFRRLAAELQVAMPVSVFERANNAYYNTIAMVDADGSVLGVYRKSHIPDGPGYEEKFYFNPGDTGFKVWQTRYGAVGCGICWDQWYPEAARCMALMGADVLLYPTAIGSEPQDGGLDSQAHWTRVMQGHAGANLIPLVASNRIGTEEGERFSQTFYGSSFIAGPTGELVAQAGRTEEEVLVASLDLDAIRAQRASWGVFRDRRPELYGPILTYDGVTRPA
ncbi:N-carbamoylputrescine amidase [Inquilinus sp. Marseille-Q2685]|uniref:N-carbamoylputrescine amidase n=1 Tax=Inquilinus sp. Marseille-Q2685 TaxID=2866581 RepID=UPI001CE3CB26|nr:N-carbamoylputrescine amidase [Inquilinus sp. Marseille-Q2685]